MKRLAITLSCGLQGPRHIRSTGRRSFRTAVLKLLLLRIVAGEKFGPNSQPDEDIRHNNIDDLDKTKVAGTKKSF
jgi:hypothetical protein